MRLAQSSDSSVAIGNVGMPEPLIIGVIKHLCKNSEICLDLYKVDAVYSAPMADFVSELKAKLQEAGHSPEDAQRLLDTHKETVRLGVFHGESHLESCVAWIEEEERQLSKLPLHG